jgi:hypothetical protein
MTDDALTLASFVIQALDLGDAPEALAPEIVSLKQDKNASISSIELDSSVGTAAFLIYHYKLNKLDDQKRSGRAIFDADLATLEQATRQDTPGPRLLAHATAGSEGFILATTPATYRAMTGAQAADNLEATAGDLLPGSATEEIRRQSAGELLRLLKEAETHAASWLRAIQAEGRMSPESGGDQLVFNEEETALALFLLDDRSIGSVLQVLNVVLTAARNRASGPFPN